MTEPAAFEGLEGDWTELHNGCPAACLSDGFAWARLAWRMVGQPRGRKLRCVVVRRGGRIQALWPLVVGRRGPWRIAGALNSESTEYSPFLAHPEADPEGVWSAIAEELDGWRDVDALSLANVPDEGLLGGFLAAAPGAVRVHSIVAPVLRRSQVADWGSFQRRLPRNVRKQLRRDRERLEALGEVGFQDVIDPGQRQEVWDWALACKRRWLKRNGLQSKWLVSDDYARFMAASLAAPGLGGQRRVFVLTLDGATIAATVGNVDQVRLEAFVSTFDERYTPCAPGNLIREACVRWALDRGLDFDHRIGSERYKVKWATELPTVSAYAVPLTRSGELFVKALAARHSPTGRRLVEALRWPALGSASSGREADV